MDWVMAHDPPPPGVMRALIDTRISGATPIYYSMKRVAEWLNRHQQPGQRIQARIASLYRSPSFYVTLVQYLITTLRFSTKIAFFYDDREAAIEWLCRQE
jgi:hypothetical protein